MKTDMALFESYEIRRVYDEDAEIGWFSVVDIIQALTQQPDYQTARKYWNKLKERLNKEGSQSVTNCHRLKLPKENTSAAQKGRSIAKRARENLENKTGNQVVSGDNYLPHIIK